MKHLPLVMGCLSDHRFHLCDLLFLSVCLGISIRDVMHVAAAR